MKDLTALMKGMSIDSSTQGKLTKLAKSIAYSIHTRVMERNHAAMQQLAKDAIDQPGAEKWTKHQMKVHKDRYDYAMTLRRNAAFSEEILHVLLEELLKDDRAISLVLECS